MQRNTPLVAAGPRPGLAALLKKRGEHPHVVEARQFVSMLLRAVELAERGFEYRVLGAHMVARQWAVMVGGGCQGVVPTVHVWSKHGSWTLTPAQARLLAGSVQRMAGVDVSATLVGGSVR